MAVKSCFKKLQLRNSVTKYLIQRAFDSLNFLTPSSWGKDIAPCVSCFPKFKQQIYSDFTDDFEQASFTSELI